MRGAIRPFPNTPSCRRAQLNAQGQIYLYMCITYIGRSLMLRTGMDPERSVIFNQLTRLSARNFIGTRKPSQGVQCY